MLSTKVCDTMSILRPQFWCLSPALGSLATNGSLNKNITQQPHSVSESLLARELFLLAGGKLRATTTRSKPGAHLDASTWGSVVGLALAGADPETVKTVLKDEHGVATRLGNQSNPPPSFKRYLRVVELVGEVLQNDRRVGSALLTHFMWEKSQSKQDCLEYLTSVHSRSLQPVLRPDFIEDSQQQAAWIDSAFSEDEIMDESNLESAALRLLDDSGSDVGWAQGTPSMKAGPV